jgi:soluble lytic murein transglycosylase-like protein
MSGTLVPEVAVRRAGALGPMQLMPDTYDQMARLHRLGEDPFNPRANIMAGAADLRWLHARYGYPICRL